MVDAVTAEAVAGAAEVVRAAAGGRTACAVAGLANLEVGPVLLAVGGTACILVLRACVGHGATPGGGSMVEGIVAVLEVLVENGALCRPAEGRSQGDVHVAPHSGVCDRRVMGERLGGKMRGRRSISIPEEDEHVGPDMDVLRG